MYKLYGKDIDLKLSCGNKEKLIKILESLNQCTFDFNGKEYVVCMPKNYYKNSSGIEHISYWSDNVCVTVYARRVTGWFKMFTLTRFYTSLMYRDIEEWNSSLHPKIIFNEEVKHKHLPSLKRIKIEFMDFGASVLDKI